MLCEHLETGIRVKVIATEDKLKSIDAAGSERETVVGRSLMTCGGQPVRPWSDSDYHLCCEVGVLCGSQWVKFTVVHVTGTYPKV